MLILLRNEKQLIFSAYAHLKVTYIWLPQLHIFLYALVLLLQIRSECNVPSATVSPPQRLCVYVIQNKSTGLEEDTLVVISQGLEEHLNIMSW